MAKCPVRSNEMAKIKKTEPGFEGSMRELEKIVGQLETGELPLEEALELFEQGIGLARRCQLQLEDAERKVELLLRERGEIKAVPFSSQKSVQIDSPNNDGDNDDSEFEDDDEEEDENSDGSVPF